VGQALSYTLEIAAYMMVENQAHEYFLMAFAMLINILIDALHSYGLDKLETAGCGSLSVEIHFNPLVLLWLLLAIPLLGGPRKKLHHALYLRSIEEEAEGTASPPTRAVLKYRKRCGWDKLSNMASSLMVLAVGFVLIFAECPEIPKPVTELFTMQEQFLRGNYECETSAGRIHNCVGFVENSTLGDFSDLSVENQRLEKLQHEFESTSTVDAALGINTTLLDCMMQTAGSIQQQSNESQNCMEMICPILPRKSTATNTGP